MSNNTILKALERMGYKGRMTGHGFRGVASTLLHEMGFDHAHIELQLGAPGAQRSERGVQPRHLPQAAGRNDAALGGLPGHLHVRARYCRSSAERPDRQSRMVARISRTTAFASSLTSGCAATCGPPRPSDDLPLAGDSQPAHSSETSSTPCHAPGSGSTP
jgi:hypothetical protein